MLEFMEPTTHSQPNPELSGCVVDYAHVLAGKPPIALSLMKNGLNRATAGDFETALEYEVEAQARCLGTHDFREAMAAWRQKRVARYEGRSSTVQARRIVL